MIYTVRDYKIMLDSDLSRLYEVETKVLNQAVKRNIERFPSDFMFRLTDEEWLTLRSHSVTFSNDSRKYKPYAFTEHGILMLSSVLKSPIASDINIQIMRIFVKMRHYWLKQTDTSDQIAELRKLLMLYIEKNDKRVNNVIIALNNLLESPPPPKKTIGFRMD
ncbi:DNA-binding protein [Spirochaetia bacterium]|nr:DNA-binding protein [Spirochaetia bacterium]GHV83668.1 DNA-binding protein [Spirochaetia bacterium]